MDAASGEIGQFEIHALTPCRVEHDLRRAYCGPNSIRALAPEGKSTPYLSGLYVDARGKETWGEWRHVPGRPVSGEARVLHESLKPRH